MLNLTELCSTGARSARGRRPAAKSRDNHVAKSRPQVTAAEYARDNLSPDIALPHGGISANISPPDVLEGDAEIARDGTVFATHAVADATTISTAL